MTKQERALRNMDKLVQFGHLPQPKLFFQRRLNARQRRRYDHWDKVSEKAFLKEPPL